MDSEVGLLDLPNEVLLNILSYFSFDDITKLRLISSKINHICVRILNGEYQKILIAHRKVLKNAKPGTTTFYIFKKEGWLLKCLEKTLGVYVKEGYCVFYPGKILDIIHERLKSSKDNRLFAYHSPSCSAFKKLVKDAMTHFTDCVQPRYKRNQLNLRKSSKSHVQRNNQHDYYNRRYFSWAINRSCFRVQSRRRLPLVVPYYWYECDK